MPFVRAVFLPLLLTAEDLKDRAVVVFDVLRATTTMATALANGAPQIWAYDSLDAVRAARQAFAGPHLTVGERDARRPDDFDLGNSPGDFSADRCAGRTLLMATTNGTRALVAARSAPALFTGALVNATATARAVLRTGRDVTLLASGTQGTVSTEDVLGIGAVIAAMNDVAIENDSAQLAMAAWEQAKSALYDALFRSFGGRNIRAAGLDPDIAFAATVDRFTTVCRVDDRSGQLVVTAQ
ncbi:MAG: 2-phosphosulfolactate phosphatase [Tepidisphaeraceae bacterium]